MSTNNASARIETFEKQYNIYYFNDKEREEMGLSTRQEIVGSGFCHICHQDVDVVSDDGLKGRERGHRSYNYFANHYRNGNNEVCPGSEQPFSTIV
jgi:hypothetical protein